MINYALSMIVYDVCDLLPTKVSILYPKIHRFLSTFGKNRVLSLFQNRPRYMPHFYRFGAKYKNIGSEFLAFFVFFIDFRVYKSRLTPKKSLLWLTPLRKRLVRKHEKPIPVLVPGVLKQEKDPSFRHAN